MKKNMGVLVLLSMVLTGCWDTGSGEHVGQVIKLNKEGLFCKTWEAEIIKGGLTSGSGAAGGAFKFTISRDHPEMIKALTDAMNSGEEVRVHYNMEAGSWCRSESNSTFADRVTAISGSVNPNRESVQTDSVDHPGMSPSSSRDLTIDELLKVQAALLVKLAGQNKP